MSDLRIQTLVHALAPDRHRYPGVRSFTERDAPRFFGRERASHELLLRVLSVRLLLQFAPSGAGKTSLLHAGLFPQLRPHGYLPVTVRLNQPTEPLVAAASRSLAEAARESDVRDPVIPPDANSLWDLLAGTQCWSADLLLLTPVLVFDQFEEVFTLRDDTFRRDFAQQVGELTRGRRATDAGGGPVGPMPAAKIIISLREEYLGALEEMSGAIPDLFRERLRLPPLTVDEAKDAIVKPARLEGEWWSPRFEFDTESLSQLISFIDGVSERVRVIEPLTLQLVCQQAELLAVQRGAAAATPLTFGEFGGEAGLEALVLGYYTRELARIGDRGRRRQAALMFEHGLLDPSGKRLMLEQGEIERRYGLDDETLHALVESRLLRREPRAESVFFEISHDRLTDVIARHRRARLPGWVKPALGVAAAFIAVLSIALLYVVRAWNDTERANQNTAQALDALLGETLVARLREAGLSDALHQILQRTPTDGIADPLARARQLRREGELLWERGTLAEAARACSAALAVIDAAVQGGRSSLELQVERAQSLKLLGDVHGDRFEVSDAEARYADATRHWAEILKTDASPAHRLSAAEALSALAAMRNRLGDVIEAELGYVDAADMSRAVLLEAYHWPLDASAEGEFLLGRAMQVYADAGLGLARIWFQSADLQGARALAAESLRLRPLSAQARVQLGTASAMLGASLVQAGDWSRVQRLLDESGAQFAEVTQFDPSNRRLARELVALRLLGADAVAECAGQPQCRKGLPLRRLLDAELMALDAGGRFQELANRDRDSRSLQDDLVWVKRVQADLKRARGAHAEALALLDEALVLHGEVVRDERDMAQQGVRLDLRHRKAQTLDAAGRSDEAMRVIDEALAEANPLRDAPMQAFRPALLLQLKASLLSQRGRRAEAARLEAEGARLTEPAVEAVSARDQRATTAYAAALALQATPNGLPADVLRVHEEAATEYRKAAKDAPFATSHWHGIRSACGWMAHAAESSRDAAAQETARRCALSAAWMAWVLSDDGTAAPERARALGQLYEERRSLALLLRNRDDRVADALLLAGQGVREAEAHAHLDGWSPEALYLVADAYYGLAMMREESKVAGWEPAFRAAVGYGEQLAAREPTAAGRRLWVGQVRTEFAERLEAHAQPEASIERGLARRDCQQALRLAKTPDDRDSAQACLAPTP